MAGKKINSVLFICLGMYDDVFRAVFLVQKLVFILSLIIIIFFIMQSYHIIRIYNSVCTQWKN